VKEEEEEEWGHKFKGELIIIMKESFLSSCFKTIN